MRILLIVTASIAAVKSYDLVRQLVKKNHQVTVVLTKAAQNFVTLEAMTVLTGQKTYTSLFDLELEQNIGHIALSRQCDIILVAPATAHFIAQISHGLCDDLATTLIAASDKPIYIAPAMNPVMWDNVANQKNLALLNQHSNISFISPETGLMACKETGIGRMSEIETIIDYIENDIFELSLKDKNILITAGATVEKIDPVRFISNFSSGKQGLALAKTAVEMGANVTLITGKMTVDIPNNFSQSLTLISVQTADEMLAACLENLPVDIVIMTAAVCDWKPEYQTSKLKKKIDKNQLTLNFVKNSDILRTIGYHINRPKYVVGFAAETDDLYKNAYKKLIDKNCDAIYANHITQDNNIFGSDTNSVTEITKNTQETLDKCSKTMVSKWMLERISKHFQ